MIYAKLSYAKSASARPGDRLNGFKNGKILLLGSHKMSLFPKIVERSFKSIQLRYLSYKCSVKKKKKDVLRISMRMRAKMRVLQHLDAISYFRDIFWSGD